MPFFDQKKVSEDITVWLVAIGMLTVFFFVGKAIFRTPILLVAVGILTPFIGFVWSRFNISLFDEYEMKNVAMAMFAISIFCSISIGLNNGKVESYYENIFLRGKTVQYQQYVEEQEQYDGRKVIPPHYETAYRFEPYEKGHWAIAFIEYTIFFICFGIPIINYFVLGYAIKRAAKMKKDAEYKRKRRAFIHSHLQ